MLITYWEVLILIAGFVLASLGFISLIYPNLNSKCVRKKCSKLQVIVDKNGEKAGIDPKNIKQKLPLYPLLVLFIFLVPFLPFIALFAWIFSRKNKFWLGVKTDIGMAIYCLVYSIAIIVGVVICIPLKIKDFFLERNKNKSD
ncbi:hypothetical protein A3F08_02780 [Candidatus Berkelbacteria bacterium RIFCSPHIGHO2_12_FULL_36_9]|uniref:Uncharacterized protein n=1 Tax=Candidatus Berkelbacteria bacterium RIFCSPHIGHO2_12_FULL_36_9 TaxID=1797469 RepID=A0A1F5EDP1_9BACT|nr:MAG: hypothetical protein A3F08_02780 [Candidatus Berkelbacteria bacterium RIFCSPHIGHO2_12_FULL_36_9]